MKFLPQIAATISTATLSLHLITASVINTGETTAPRAQEIPMELSDKAGNRFTQPIAHGRKQTTLKGAGHNATTHQF